MSLQSLIFAIFFIIVLLSFYILPTRFRKSMWLISSFIFYLFCGWKNLLVLFLVTVVSYIFGRFMFGKYRNKPILITGIVLTVFPLILLKYINPFDALAAGLGISFFTLQGISFLVDSYKGNADSNISFLDYAIYMSFFPTISSGPIKRTDEFTSELNKKRAFDYDRVRSGLIKMGIGYVYKLILADGLARAVSFVFDYKETLPSGAQILFATILFGFQLFFDFAGYSHIAIGAAKVLGIDMPENFEQPYFAVSIKDFWRRWHISLSGWLRDYIYIPLGGSRRGAFRKNINLLLTFLVSGFWHGVGLNYIFWGALHGIYQIIGGIKEKVFSKRKQVPSGISRIISCIIVFALTDYAWLYFRANSLSDGFTFTKLIFTDFRIDSLSLRWLLDHLLNKQQMMVYAFSFALAALFEVLSEMKKDVIALICRAKWYVRWIVYTAIIFLVLVGYITGLGSDMSAFIYNKF